jgi:hypothetical protein
MTLGPVLLALIFRGLAFELRCKVRADIGYH